ncbi:Aliphatic sulfonates import ATP-binding protein SsuB [Achromobacter spanius]|jgi:NitT/TauT family transport system ATP-binding protein|uniref:ABC transporter ATP-binding protein n=1 Tax=Achromobacter spanius TaxID=217203 RepID=A0AA42S5N5_9BURK|nr:MULTISPECIES: ABC transporter ATP-binding protein [Achromobacter]SPT42185.1 Aliphatic sulfonates import ATP-binding protein SsuB [Achromobacter denitrificans]AUA58072.1 ABC transporter ATP-binding protein [Achromobacter spanius]MCS3505944.1 NitT/TauT family transport system ATP-binding protein [Achromobacter sp. JUb104]MDH0737858.1 ABC transporter ATP-binding protein [Achromobacter spanius]CAB3624872.1 Taurine import ATP-binding protein TauB [Achromobacter spanius]
MNLNFDHVHKHFGDLPVVDGFTSEIKAGELVALVGPSGCGKSTLLHLAAGLEMPTQGSVLADGKPVAGPHPSRTLVFQEHALYPWLTLEDNVALALEFQNVAKKRARESAREWLARVSLAGFEHYYPHQVSGGMRQRAALARAFIAQPQTMLMDEPFGALDALTRLSLQDVLRQLIAQEKPTVLLVTHDVDEALFLADRIVVFSPRPARVLREFNLAHRAKTHDLSDLAAEKREILRLLGIAVDGSQAHADMALAA